MKKSKNIAIIGGGPSGLMAAEIIAGAGHLVTIYDHMPSLGRKLLMAGRGGLNLTHSEPMEKFICRYGASSKWLEPYINAFTPDDLRAWCEGLGQETFIGSSGRIFPRSMKAAPLLRAWLHRLDKLGVTYKAKHSWQGWNADSLQFIDDKKQIFLVKPYATLLALGGASWPRLGSNGSWVKILNEYGIDISPLSPANCGFIANWSDYFSNRFAGQPLKSVALTHNNITNQGELMITAKGLEGGAIYAISARLRESIAAENSTLLNIDLRPGMSLDTLTQKLKNLRGAQSLSTCLRKAGFPPQAIGLLRETTTPAKDAATLAAQLKCLPVTFTGTTGIGRAISTAGGIKQSALNNDFMLNAKPGVFATGEMLDWEAPTGGYLLQGCFSTAVAVAHGILRFCTDEE